LKIHKTPVVVMADDDDDDCMLARDAFKESGAGGDFLCVEDGIELFDYLSRTGLLPALILLDLNMPKKDGREALAEIKADPALRRIPVVVMTTSKAEEDIFRMYDLGSNSFISKPITLTAPLTSDLTLFLKKISE